MYLVVSNIVTRESVTAGEEGDSTCALSAMSSSGCESSR